MPKNGNELDEKKIFNLLKLLGAVLIWHEIDSFTVPAMLASLDNWWRRCCLSLKSALYTKPLRSWLVHKMRVRPYVFLPARLVTCLSLHFFVMNSSSAILFNGVEPNQSIDMWSIVYFIKEFAILQRSLSFNSLLFRK